MTHDEFEALSVREQLMSLKAHLNQSTATAVFGDSRDKIDDVRRNLVKAYHPDLHRQDKDVYGLAEDFIADLNTLYDSWDESGVMTERVLGVGEISRVTANADGSVTKRLTTGDVDLFKREAEILTEINALPLYASEAFKYIPRLLVDDMDDGGYYHIIGYSDDVRGDELISLTALAEMYDRNIPVKAIAWIWRRVLAALSIPHAFGYLHGCVLPDNIMLKPGMVGEKQHRGYLIDWTCATKSGAKFPYVVDKWEAFYPPEVLTQGDDNSVPATDIYMAAKSMLWACTNMPAAMKRYFSACTLPDKYARLYKPSQLFDLFDKLMYDELGWQKEFVPLNVTVVDWEWWR